MAKFIQVDPELKMSATLKVIGVGGGGCNAIDYMIQRGLSNVDYVGVNTDAQALEACLASHKIAVGVKTTRGLGAGANPTIGKKAVEDDKDKIVDVLRGCDMVFITAGMGGGTGTGGAPVVASLAREMGILTVAIVTKPFKWEGHQKMKYAERGLQELRHSVDSLIVIPNERLLGILDKNTSAFQAFDKPNEILYEATRGIAEIILIKGMINVDFADVKSVMDKSGVALMGTGTASGENRSIEAAQKAISNPLLEGVSIKGARSILVNITGSSNLTMHEVYEGNNVIFEAAGDEAHVIFGCVRKDEMNDFVSYTVIATGFDREAAFAPKPVEQEIGNNGFGNAHSGFSKNLIEESEPETENTDIEFPAILRKSATRKVKPIRAAEENQPTLNFEGFINSPMEDTYRKSRQNPPKNSIEDDEDDEASSLLRIMLD
ncbi:MAG: cell division protein FtsZ [Ignavibacteriaceae bacterium]|nr:cell division protein FtsZ [Ignavibacteriaceae bacterium]